MNKSITTIIVLTFIGMVGIYIGAYYAWEKYQSYKAQTGSVGGALNLLSGFVGG